jgi:hypothetical protein
MLSSAGSPFRRARLPNHTQRRSLAVPQPQQLSWLDLEPRAPAVWDRVDEADRTLVIAALAALLAKAVAAAHAEEAAND